MKHFIDNQFEIMSKEFLRPILNTIDFKKVSKHNKYHQAIILGLLKSYLFFSYSFVNDSKSTNFHRVCLKRKPQYAL